MKLLLALASILFILGLVVNPSVFADQLEHFVIQCNDKIYDIRYSVFNGKVNSINPKTISDFEVNVGTRGDSYVIVVIPRELFDSDMRGKEVFVLIDKEEIQENLDFIELTPSDDSEYRTFKVNFGILDYVITFTSNITMDIFKPKWNCSERLEGIKNPFSDVYLRHLEFLADAQNHKKHFVTQKNIEHEILYTINFENEIVGIQPDLDARSLILNMNAKTDGMLTISIPHQLLEDGYFEKCLIDYWFVLHDGEEHYIPEKMNRQQVGIVEIPFSKGVKEIEIIGNYVPSTSETYGSMCFKKFQHEMNPREQITSGFSLNEIICKDNLKLIFKHDESPACVKLESIPKLIERGWGTIE